MSKCGECSNWTELDLSVLEDEEESTVRIGVCLYNWSEDLITGRPSFEGNFYDDEACEEGFNEISR